VASGASRRLAASGFSRDLLQLRGCSRSLRGSGAPPLLLKVCLQPSLFDYTTIWLAADGQRGQSEIWAPLHAHMSCGSCLANQAIDLPRERNTCHFDIRVG